MTQLIIDGTEAILPQNFSVTVKRENSFFTKSGEYTYDCTLRLGNIVNQHLYGFIGRINKADQIETKRTAVLIADGHVYCRGTEIITRWTDDTVTIQIVSGESEMNYFMGQNKKLEDLNLGAVTTDNWDTILRKHNEHRTDRDNGELYCTPPMRTGSSGYNSDWKNQQGFSESVLEQLLPQPYMVPLAERLFHALGYQTVDLSDLMNTGFDYLFLVNNLHTVMYNEMFAGWKVLDMITAIEQLTGHIFVVNKTENSVTAIKKRDYFDRAAHISLRNIVDQYEAEEMDSDSQDDADWASSNVRYDLPDSNASKLMELSEEIKSISTIVECESLSAIRSAMTTASESDKKIYKDLSTNRYYITRKVYYSSIKVVKVTESWKYVRSFRYTFESTSVHHNLVPWEVDMFAELHRSDAAATVEIDITPAPFTFGSTWGCEVMDLSGELGDGTEQEEAEPESFFELIETYSKKEASARHIYAAFFSGMYDYVAIAYTDKNHAARQKEIYGYTVTDSPTDPNEYEFYGSLRLKDIDREMYTSKYGIDTAHPITFETYDPNVIDPRQVYIIRNRAYVVRDIEETITAEGRQKKWKLTCYPMAVDEETLTGWILETGNWNDAAGWLDDGRWYDSPEDAGR